MRKEMLIFAAIIFTTSLTASPSIPSSVGYLLVITAYAALFLVLVSDELPVFYYRPVLYPAAIIAAMFVVTFVINFERSSILRLLAFTLFTGVNLLVVPALIERRAAFKALGRVSALFIVIALPVTLFGAYTVGMITVGAFGLTRHFGPLVYHIPRSIFISSNSIAALGAFGTIAAGAEWSSDRSYRAGALVALNAAGVFMTISRAGLLSLGAGVGLYIVYRLFDVRGLAAASIAGLAALVVLFLTMIDALYIPVISSITPTGRDIIWKATIDAILQQPLIGWGLGNDAAVIDQWISAQRFQDLGTHNSYLRLFLIGGIVAGASYLVLTIASLVSSLREAYAESRSLDHAPVEGVFVVILLVVFLVRQTFSDPTIYGVNSLSVIGAIVVGYTQPRSAVHTLALPATWIQLRQDVKGNIRILEISIIDYISGD